MSRTQLLAMVLAGGEGTRLRPLTTFEAKPALHFALGYRIIDFVLANLFNSRAASVYVLAQYKPATLIQHIDGVWRPQARVQGVALDVVLPDTQQQGLGFRGTADAVYHCMELVER